MHGDAFLARLASDEFVIVIDSRCTTREEASQLATRAAHSLFRKITQPYLVGHHTLHVTASLGVAFFGPGLADSSDLLLMQTDAAMYEAKRRQRGTIQFFDESTQKYLNDQADMANRLRGALAANHFMQLYQPQVDQQGRVVGVEALLRWHDPQLGDISPSAFIPLAESLHLIVDIDRWVLSQACRTAGSWRQDPILGNIKLSVNVSAEYFSLDEFIDEVTGYLDQSGAKPAQLMIELTEGSLVEDTEANILKIRALQEAGLRVAIDDFGTGNSSLAYLRRFEVDQIKIDQRFTRDMIENERSLAITTFIIQLAHELGIPTLAEGVENDTQRQQLITLGCDLFQGFMFSRPLPLAECESTIRQAASKTD
jgi:EAL domain-containing protein (putative c-di-GMP-specific phosphodiesterase class I)